MQQDSSDNRLRTSADALIGTTISRYRILSRIGRGGMGVVYKALDTSLDRKIALKFLPSYHSADEEAEKRFVVEARAASALDHPNIAVIHEIDRTTDGRMYMAMAYYDGETLREKLKRGPLPVDEAITIARQIAEGLHRAHEEGIVHRDVKPENVIVTKRGLAKILDFGLAKMQDVNLTVSGTSMGTLAYMSPEQAFGGPIDHRADLWALGVITYEMLTGRHPFLKPGAAQASVLYATANEQHESVMKARPEVPESCSRVIDALLEKDPARRYGSTGDVVRDLRAAETGGNDVAATVAFASAAARTDVSSAPAVFRALRVPFAALLATAVLIAVGLVWMAASDGAGSDDRELARAHVNEGLAYYSDAQYAQAQAELERAIELDPAYSAAWSSLAATDIQLEQFDEAIEKSRTAIRLDSLNSSAYYNLAIALEERGEVIPASEAYQKAIDVDPGFVQAYSALGNLYVTADQADRALSTLRLAEERVPQSELMFLVYKNMGKAYVSQLDFEAAADVLERSLTLRPDWPETIALLAVSYEELGRVDQSRELLRRYLEIEPDAERRDELQRRLSLDS